MKISFLSAMIVAGACVLLCAAPPGPHETSMKPSIERADGGINFAALNERLLAVISDKRSTEEDLRRAIDHLGRPVESPKFWTAIANDDAYKTEHRRKCIFAFFRRHTMAESSLTSLASILDNPTWLHFDRIQRIDVLTGWIPVEATINDTVFRVPVLSDRYSIYFRL